MPEAKEIVELLGVNNFNPELKNIYESGDLNYYDIHKSVEIFGLYSESFIRFTAGLNFKSRVLAARAVPISMRALNRHIENKDWFDRTVSNNMVKLTGICLYGRDVFEDTDRFKDWMRRPCTALGDILPITLLSSSTGLEILEKQLQRIDYGVYG